MVPRHQLAVRGSLQNGLTFSKIPRTAKPIQRLDPDQFFGPRWMQPFCHPLRARNDNSGSTSKLETL
jgi:hypothetical protein